MYIKTLWHVCTDSPFDLNFGSLVLLNVVDKLTMSEFHLTTIWRRKTQNKKWASSPLFLVSFLVIDVFQRQPFPCHFPILCVGPLPKESSTRKEGMKHVCPSFFSFFEENKRINYKETSLSKKRRVFRYKPPGEERNINHFLIAANFWIRPGFIC